MLFANPIFLFGLAGAAVPVLIHLLTRDRIQRVAFSTLRFFAKGAKRVVRRNKFQELLLLLMRVALLALLAITFARPFLGAGPTGSRHAFSTARVVVLDVSGSMRRPDLAEASKKEALAALGSLRDGRDAAAVITFADTPGVPVALGESLATARGAVEAATPGYGGTNIAEAIRRANELLRGIYATKEIVVISDFQRAGWHDFKGDWKLDGDVKLTIDAVKPGSGQPGVGITEMSVPDSLVLDKQPSSLVVRVANYADQPQTGLDVALLLDGKKVDAQKVNVRAHDKVAVRFRHVFDTPGDHPGSVVVGSNDDQAAGRVVYFNARTLPRIPVLLIDGRPSSVPQTDAAFFLDKALAPTEASPFAVTTIPADKVNAQDIAASGVVILANVGRIPPPAADALGALLDRGGGLFFLPGDQASPEVFNSELGKFAPFKLRQILQARPTNGEPAESLVRIDYDHPIFNVFSLPHHGDLGLPKFARYWETTDTQLSRVLARFGDDRPAILERRIGRGISTGLVSAIDENWNDFAKQSVFLPFLHQTVRYLAIQTGRQTTYHSGDWLPVATGDTLKGPQGETIAIAASNDGKTGAYAAQPGFYRSFNQTGQPDFCYAVNGSLTEADPATVAGDEIVSAIQRAPGEALGSLDLGLTARPGNEKKDTGWWWYLVWGIVALSLAELVVANKTLRH